MENSILNLETEITDDNNVRIINSESDAYVLSYYINSISNEQTMTKIIKAVESMVRGSSNYSQYIGYLKDTIGLDHDSFMPNVREDMENKSLTVIQMHHHPFTLYDIVETVVLDNILHGQQFSTPTLAGEVIALHFNNMIGVVPLSETNHQLVHDGALQVTNDMVYGNVSAFIEKYRKSFSPKAKIHYNRVMNNELNIDIFT